MRFVLRPASVLCYLVGYAVLAGYHRHEPALLGYVLLLVGVLLHLLKPPRKRA